MRTLTIGRKTITREEISKPYFVAEAGVNHEGELKKARLMIEQAARAGADAIKFQTYKAEKLASKFSSAYWDTAKETTRSQFELFKKYDQFGYEEFKELANYAKELGLDFLSTPFDFEAVDFLEDLVPAYKIASADITYYPFLEYIARKGKPVLLSTGASSVSEIYQALDVIEKAGNTQVVLLHSILNYPTPAENANLGMIWHMNRVFFDNIIGYSDHTLPEYSKEILFISWLLGAQVIEKHFTFDKSLPGNDHYHAIDEADLIAFQKFLDFSLKMMGSFRKHYLPEEVKSRQNARRSLVAARSIKKGEKLRPEDIEIKRPGTGIPPVLLDLIGGMEASRDIDKDEVIPFNAIKFVALENHKKG
jgi:N-acetylneuraminate synthase